MKFNINETVRVRLTDYGKKVHREDHDRFWSKFGEPPEYLPPKEDENGWSEWQLWCLMQDFGNHVGLGKQTPFEIEIEVPNDGGNSVAACGDPTEPKAE